MGDRSLRPTAAKKAALLVVAVVAAGIPAAAGAESAPAFARFDYSMPDRYVDADSDGLYPDPVSHVECSDPEDASSCHTIAPTLDVEPDEGWRVDLDACASTPGPDEAEYRWSFADTDEPLDVLPGDEPCRFVAMFPNEGTYDIKLFIVKPGESSTRIETVRVQDWLIVSMGDSLGAGEGSPNVDAVGDGEPLWQDRSCHRSSQAGSAKAAQLLEELDPRTSVTFVHTSCSGARTMEGLLEPYAGVDRLLGDKYPEVTLRANGEIPMLPPQVHTASQVVGTREIDAVYLSIGANDIHFGDLVQVCAVAEPCDAFDFAFTGLVLEALVCGLLAIVPIAGLACAALALALDAALTASLGDSWIFDTAAEIFERGFDGDGSADSTCEDCGLERLYDFIAASLTRGPSSAGTPSRSQVGLGLPAADANRVSIAPYPDPITKPHFDVDDPDSFLCGGVEDTLTMFPGISRNETRYMFNTVMPQFEDKISSEAGEHDWHFLEGVSSTNLFHGYCAEDRYVRRLDDVLAIQNDIQGVLHPNRTGYNVYRNVVLEQWLTQMYGGTGAGIAASDSTTNATLLAQSFLETHDPRDPAVPTADAGGPYVVDEGDTVVLDGTGSDPDDRPLTYAWELTGGHDVAGLTGATTEDPSLHGTDDGGGRALLTVVNDLGRAATDGASYVVNNVAPAVDAGADAALAEGSTLSRTVLVSDPGAADTHTSSVTWGDGTSAYVPSASPPSIDISHVYADDGSYTVEVCAVDDDAGQGCDSFEVTVTNALPTVSVDSAAAADGFFLPGVSVPLAGAFTDAGTADSHGVHVAWGDTTSSSSSTAGVTVIELPFGPPGSTSGLTGAFGSAHTYAAPGLYELVVTVTDDDGGPGAASQQVEVLTPAEAARRAGVLLAALAVDPTVTASARRELQDALRYLVGTPQSNDGADRKLLDGDVSAGMQKLSAAMLELEAAIARDPSILDEVRLIELVVAQIAESVAVDALARARAAFPNPTARQAEKLTQAQGLLDEGRAVRASSLPGAVATFRDSVTKSLSVR